MRAIRGADDDEPRDAIGETLAESQRHHAAIGSAGDGAQARDAEMIDEAQQQFGLVVGGHASGTARRRAARWNRRSRRDSRNSGCGSAAYRARGPAPPLRATSRRAAHRATTRGATRKCRRSPRPPARPPDPRDAMRWKPIRACRRNAASARREPPARLRAPGCLWQPGSRSSLRETVCCRCSSSAPPKLSTQRGTRERPCGMHGTCATPDGAAEGCSSAGTTIAQGDSAGSWHLSACAAVAPASSGLIPQPVSMSARIL